MEKQKPALSSENNDTESITTNIQDLSFKPSNSISLCSSTVFGSDISVSSSNMSNASTVETHNKNAEPVVDCEESDTSSLSYASKSNNFDGNESKLEFNFRVNLIWVGWVNFNLGGFFFIWIELIFFWLDCF
jgi:hypothetical protein